VTSQSKARGCLVVGLFRSLSQSSISEEMFLLQLFAAVAQMIGVSAQSSMQ